MKNSIKEYMSMIGMRGGKKTAKKGREYYAKIGKKGAKKRWKKSVDNYSLDIPPAIE